MSFSASVPFEKILLTERSETSGGRAPGGGPDGLRVISADWTAMLIFRWRRNANGPGP